MAKKLVGVIQTSGQQGPVGPIGPAGGVNSFNERQGDVTPQFGDYDPILTGSMPATEILTNSDVLDIWANA